MIELFINSGCSCSLVTATLAGPQVSSKRQSPQRCTRRRVAAAQGDIVVFAEDHTQLNGPWVETLLRLYADRRISAIGWTIQPGHLKTTTSWSGFLVEYGWWGPGVASGAPVTHLPGHNSSYRRSRLLSYGADLNRLMLAEAFLHWDLARQGDLLYFTTDIHRPF